MSGLKPLLAAAVISMISATSVLAQEPAAFASQYPDRDVLNGGALTPAGRLGLELPNGAASSPAANAAANAYAGVGIDGPAPTLRPRRYHTNGRHPSP
jgi:hypothetical protein